MRLIHALTATTAMAQEPSPPSQPATDDDSAAAKGGFLENVGIAALIVMGLSVVAAIAFIVRDFQSFLRYLRIRTM